MFPKFVLNTDTTCEGNQVRHIEVMINACIEDNKSSCYINPKKKNSCKWTQIMLYNYPKIESIDMFHPYDLDSSSIFLLLVPIHGHEYLQYVEEVYV